MLILISITVSKNSVNYVIADIAVDTVKSAKEALNRVGICCYLSAIIMRLMIENIDGIEEQVNSQFFKHFKSCYDPNSIDNIRSTYPKLIQSENYKEILNRDVILPFSLLCVTFNYLFRRFYCLGTLRKRSTVIKV